MCHVFFKIIVFKIISRRIVSSLGHNTSYQDHGKSADRVKMALKKPCCKAKCKRRVTFQMVMSVCITFWSLTKTAQDSLTLASHFIFTLIIFYSMFMYVCFFNPMVLASSTFFFCSPGFGAFRTLHIWISFQKLRMMMLLILIAMDLSPVALPFVHLNHQEVPAIIKRYGFYKATCQRNSRV